MIYISHELKAIYIHIPKCGGCYVREMLMKYYNFISAPFFRTDHELFCNTTKNFYDPDNKSSININKFGVLRYYCNEEYNKLTNMTKEKWETYYKFTFIRDPYKKLVSAFLYMNSGLMVNKRKDNFNYSEIYNSFDCFVKSYETIDNIGYFHAFITQYDQLLDVNNNLNINFFGTTENLSYDFLKILQLLGVTEFSHIKLLETKINKNNSTSNYCDYYNDDTLGIVNKLFEKDFEVLGFKKYNKKEEMTEIKQQTQIENIELDYNLYICKREKLLELEEINNKLMKEYIDYIERTIKIDYCDFHYYFTKQKIHDNNNYRKKILEKMNFDALKTFFNENLSEEKYTCGKCGFLCLNENSTTIHTKICTK